VTLNCDRTTHTITETTTGVNYQPNQLLRVEYRKISTYQATADSIRFTGPLGGSQPDFTHSATASASGTWSDTGWASTISPDPYYLDEQVTVVVRDLSTNLVVGGGSAYCLYIDQGHPGSALTIT
jgi:hypothetical protein